MDATEYIQTNYKDSHIGLLSKIERFKTLGYEAQIKDEGEALVEIMVRYFHNNVPILATAPISRAWLYDENEIIHRLRECRAHIDSAIKKLDRQTNE